MTQKKQQKDGSPSAGKASEEPSSSDQVQLNGKAERKQKVRWRRFPGPHGVDEPVRLSVSRRAYADLVAHAKESPSAEVCGVLVGEFCEDEEGKCVSVEGSIRGKAAKEGGSHVTFTQETWNDIHEHLEREYPKYDIVGWYHTHPGFGVEFSEMDLFIHRNFFPMCNQIAFVTDPLGGQEAVCVNTSQGIEHIRRFWVDGRERRTTPAGGGTATGEAGSVDGSGETAIALRAVENRLSQVIQALDEQRTATYRALMLLGMITGLGIVGAIGFSVYSRYMEPLQPPEFVKQADIPVRVGEDTYILGVGVVKWKCPEYVNTRLKESLLRELLREEQARKKAEAESAEGATTRPDKSSGAEAPDSVNIAPGPSKAAEAGWSAARQGTRYE